MNLIKIDINEENLQYCNKRLIKQDIPAISCIYLLFNEELEFLYVGKTDNLKTRLVMHLSPRTKSNSSIIPKSEKISYYSIIDGSLEDNLKEIVCIYLLKPKYNFTGITSKLMK